MEVINERLNVAALSSLRSVRENDLLAASQAIHDELMEALQTKLDLIQAELLAQVTTLVDKCLVEKVPLVLESFVNRCEEKIAALELSYQSGLEQLRTILVNMKQPVLQVDVPPLQPPIVHVEVPRRRTIKHITYDELGRPQTITEEEV